MTTDTPRRIELDDLRALSDAATPGPWVAQSPTDGRRLDWYLDTHYNEDGPEPVWADSYPVGAEDIEFIAAAVNYVRSLLGGKED